MGFTDHRLAEQRGGHGDLRAIDERRERILESKPVDLDAGEDLETETEKAGDNPEG